MSLTRKNKKEKVREPRTKITWKEVKRQKVLLFWAAIMVAYGVIFYYLPLAGWAMAFQDYKPRLGIFHSAFVGLDKFKMLFSDMTFIRVIRNTLAMGVINLVVTFVTAIAFAILLNEIASKGGKKVVQTISYLPHFLSWIIVTGILHDMLSGTGIVNEFLVNMHIIDQLINFFAHPGYFWPIVAFANVWKETGWNAIIYLAAITSIDPSLSGRFTYDYDQRYLVEFNFGYNGTERLAKKDRFELFPAVSLGWVISNEKFFETFLDKIDNLKIRASYGLVGSDETGSGAGRFSAKRCANVWDWMICWGKQ